MEPSLETLKLVSLVFAPVIAVSMGYFVYFDTQKTGTLKPVQRGVGVTIVLLLTLPITFGVTAMYVGSSWSYRGLYFVPILLLGIALYLFTVSKPPLLNRVKE